MPFTLLGEGKFHRESQVLPGFAAVAHATRDADYVSLLRAPADKAIRITAVYFDPMYTLAAGATNYVDLKVGRMRGTTYTGFGSTITTNTGGGWTANTQQTFVSERHNMRLNAGERLVLRFDHVGTGADTTVFTVHVEYEII